ncbi:MAG: hypothetical protein KAS32_26165 [Candidatus Peribacteraceae bacterium]|nr:hypothetical protein [Candidatus Peribacteraceae bacterium]
MILGLSGKALSGKDSVADYLLDNYYFDRKLGFASNLKTACVEVFGLTYDQVLTQQGKSTDLKKPIKITKSILSDLVSWMRKTHNVALESKDYSLLLGVELHKPRDILQFVGTEVMRYYVNDYHYEVVFCSIRENENIIITDVRFPNEALGVLKYKGNLIRIDRPKELRAVHGAILNSNHPSETALDNWDTWSYNLKNNGKTLDVLYSQVNEMLTTLELKND